MQPPSTSFSKSDSGDSFLYLLALSVTAGAAFLMLPEGVSDHYTRVVASLTAGVVSMFFVPWIHAAVKFFKFMFWVAIAVELWLLVRPYLVFVPSMVYKFKPEHPMVENAWAWFNR